MSTKSLTCIYAENNNNEMLTSSSDKVVIIIIISGCFLVYWNGFTESIQFQGFKKSCAIVNWPNGHVTWVWDFGGFPTTGVCGLIN